MEDSEMTAVWKIFLVVLILYNIIPAVSVVSPYNQYIAITVDRQSS